VTFNGDVLLSVMIGHRLMGNSLVIMLTGGTAELVFALGSEAPSSRSR
jgi:hypothetical protein